MKKKTPLLLPPHSRRQFLQYSAAAAGALGLASCMQQGDWLEPPREEGRPFIDMDAYDHASESSEDPSLEWENALLFPLGVQSGGMRPSSALVWGYTTDGKAKRLRVWRQGNTPGTVMLVRDEMVEPNDGGFMRLTVDGLAPDTIYRFAFSSTERGLGLKGRSLVGRFRTAFPEDMLWPITIGATTCTHFRTAPFKALMRTAREPVDLTVHLGDMSYNDFAVSREGYRNRWRMTLLDPGYRALLPHAGMYIAWDDHEFTNDVNPERLPASQLETAKDAFFEAVAAERGPQGQLWQSYRWGQTVEFIILDCRTERRPSTLGSGDEKYISDEQMAFFKDRLLNSPCHFKVVLNSVPMTHMPDIWNNAKDTWNGYRAAREEILGFIEEQDIKNVWFLSGDFHVGFVARLEAEGFRSGMFDIAVGPGGNDLNPLGVAADLIPPMKEDVFPSRQFLYGSGKIAMTTIKFDPLDDSVHVKFVDAGNGEVLFEQDLRQGA